MSKEPLFPPGILSGMLNGATATLALVIFLYLVFVR